MRRALLCLALFMLPTAAFADGWTAQMEEDEGGSVMVAQVLATPQGDVTPALVMMCGDTGQVNLRYSMPIGDGEPAREADFLFENESTQAKLHMGFEEMDGAFAAYVAKSDPIVTLLQTGEEVFVSESSGNYPAQTFTLKGSSKAIATLLRACK